MNEAQKQEAPSERAEESRNGTNRPARSGACPFCLRKHLLKARGYVAELAEDATREWERDKLLENLLLAEDHAEELGDESLRASIRAVRLPVESGEVPVGAVRGLYDSYIRSPRWTETQKKTANEGGGSF